MIRSSSRATRTPEIDVRHQRPGIRAWRRQDAEAAPVGHLVVLEIERPALVRP
jgi:hypothetical protein